MSDTYNEEYRLMTNKDEIKEYAITCLSDMFLGERNLTRAMERFSHLSGFGEECVGIHFKNSFDASDPEYYVIKDNEVFVSLDEPSVEENVGGYLSFAEFYEVLKEYIDKVVSKHPEKSGDLYPSLEKVKQAFGLG